MAGLDILMYLGLPMSVSILLQFSFWLIVLAACAVVARLGAKPERHGMAIMLAGSVLSMIVARSATIRFKGVEIGIVAVDFAVMIAFLVMALKSTRFWPLWVTSFQLTALLTHFGAFLMPQTRAPAYAYMQGFFAYPMLMAILLGAYGHQKALDAKRR
jgi:hypothetical protein